MSEPTPPTRVAVECLTLLIEPDNRYKAAEHITKVLHAVEADQRTRDEAIAGQLNLSMSKPTTRAPSSANRTGWLRPWPRARQHVIVVIGFPECRRRDFHVRGPNPGSVTTGLSPQCPVSATNRRVRMTH
jgi:hypothetical protein